MLEVRARLRALSTEDLHTLLAIPRLMRKILGKVRPPLLLPLF
jgi:hypothetical protein